MRKCNYIILLSVGLFFLTASAQTLIYSQSFEQERSVNIKMFDVKMNEYNCPDNRDCCVNSQTIEVGNPEHRSDVKTKSISAIDTALTEIPIVEVSSNLKLNDLKCWNTNWLVSKFCPICNS